MIPESGTLAVLPKSKRPGVSPAFHDIRPVAGNQLEAASAGASARFLET